MQVLIPSTLTAPQVTGHPQGLPGEPANPLEQTKVQPIADARNPEAQLMEGLAPTKFWRAANGEPDPTTNAAPPSIMQITISLMLDEQSPKHGSQEEVVEKVGKGAANSRPYQDPIAKADEAASKNQSEEAGDARRSALNTVP